MALPPPAPPHVNVPWLPPKPTSSPIPALPAKPSSDGSSGAVSTNSAALSGGVKLGLPYRTHDSALARSLPSVANVGPVNQVWTPPTSSSSGSEAWKESAPLLRTGMKRPHSEVQKDGNSAAPSNDSSISSPSATTSNNLPLPLPSKRFRKAPGPKAVLIPVEQLPVYALPSPPAITNPVILETVFNHQSLFPRSKGRFEELPALSASARSSASYRGGIPGEMAGKEGYGDEEVAGHYEKLEHVGDSLLGMIVTAWLHEDRPRLTCGTATKLKAHLVSNATLSHLSGLYGFPQRLRGAPDQLPVLRAQTDVRAALMEAYIAGVYFSHPPHERFTVAMGVLDKWLRSMYEPLYEFFFNYMREEYETHHLSMTSVTSLPSGVTSSKTTLLTEDEMAAIDNASQGMANLLRTYCQRQGKECRFQEERYETHCGILWGIKCFVEGRQVGEATRSGRRGAKNVAAWEGCKALGLIEDPDATVMLANGDNGHGNEPQSAGDIAHLASGSLANGDAPCIVQPHDAAREVSTADAGDMTSTNADI